MSPLHRCAFPSVIIVVLILVVLTPVTAFAAGSDGVSAVDLSAEERTLANSVSAESGGLGITVSWDDPVCGTPTTFLMEGSGGGSYSYYLNAINVETQEGWNWVVDPSHLLGYDPCNERSFTFYASGRYQFRFYVMDTSTIPRKTARVDAYITIRDPRYPSVEEIASEVVAQCEREGNATDYEKALWLHDWVVDNCSYDYNVHKTQTLEAPYVYCGIEGALSPRGLGTCESYYSGYALLLKKAGIENGRITGNGHVWNAVKMDGDWYQVDPTWDDPGYSAGDIDLKHLYFGLTDDIMALAHSDHRPNPGYESSSLTDNYFIKSGEVAQWADVLSESIRARLEEGTAQFVLPATQDNWPEAYKDIVNNIVAYELSQRPWSYKDSSLATLDVSYRDGEYTVEVLKTPIGDGSVILSGVNTSYCFTGSSIQPSVTLKHNGRTLKRGIDYDVSYSNNVYLGEATITVKGKGDYLGERRHTFRIVSGSVLVGPRNSWNTVEGKTYYYGDDCRAVKWSQKIGGSWYYFNGACQMQTGWIKWAGDGSWSYFDKNGRGLFGWQKIGESWYYLNPDTMRMATGWQKVGGAWYYLKPSGAMATGWAKVGSTWYYLKSSGAMATGWLKLGGAWYYLKPSGAMATGWYKVGNSWYYSNGSGVMQSNRWIGNYYVTSSGAMATNTWIGRYHVNASGLWDQTR